MWPFSVLSGHNVDVFCVAICCDYRWPLSLIIKPTSHRKLGKKQVLGENLLVNCIGMCSALISGVLIVLGNETNCAHDHSFLFLFKRFNNIGSLLSTKFGLICNM